MRKLLVSLPSSRSSPASAPPSRSPSKSVGMGDNYFFNGSVTIKKGSEVTWRWSQTQNLHNVISKGRSSTRRPPQRQLHRDLQQARHLHGHLHATPVGDADEGEGRLTAREQS